jgi:hypothetical protein
MENKQEGQEMEATLRLNLSMPESRNWEIGGAKRSLGSVLLTGEISGPGCPFSENRKQLACTGAIISRSPPELSGIRPRKLPR